MSEYFPSKYFNRSEFACQCGCGFNTIDYAVVDALEVIREHFDQPVTVTSGCRCKSHNKAVGGSTGSQHLQGRAADIIVKGVPARLVQELAENIGVSGLGSYDTFTHIDSRNGRSRWSG